MQSAREIVLKGLYNFENEGAYSNKVLNDVLGDKELLDIDRAFATELFLGVVKNRLRLDYIIKAFSKIRLKKLSPWVHQLLRMGIYQIIFMDNIPDSAACNESVKLGTKYANSGAKNFLNGVLRSVAREKDNIKYPNDKREWLSVFYSCPQWITDKLCNQYGEETCEKILKESHKPHRVSIRVNNLKTTGEELVKILSQEGIDGEIDPENPRCLHINGAISIDKSKAYKDGLYTIQNTSSMKAVETIMPKAEERVLDMCAAPGGKTTYMAELMGNKGEICAFDIHEHKIKLIEKSAERLGISIIKAAVGNGQEYKEELNGKFHRVLADVPCSGIGVIHKKPDIKWNRKEEDIEELCKIQKKILENAGKYVMDGGVLVYSTCTIFKEENRDMVDEFLKKNKEFSLVVDELIFTHETGGSGFYIAKMKKDKRKDNHEEKF